MTAIECKVQGIPARTPIQSGVFADITCDCGHRYTVWKLVNRCWGSDFDFCPACGKSTKLR